MKRLLGAWVIAGLMAAIAHAQPAPSEEAVRRNNRGAELLKQGKAAEAVVDLRAAIDMAPDFVTAQANLAYAYEQSGQVPEAITAYEKLLELDPDNAAARNNLAVVYGRSGRHDDAIRELETLLQRDPGDPAARRNLEIAKRNKGILDERDQRSGAAVKAAEARPHDPRAAYDVARVYAQQGEHDAALTWLGKAFALGYDQIDFVNVDPALARLRNDPRFGKLVEGRGTR